MPSRVPLTNLRDNLKGGAPLYVGGDRLKGETQVATAPEFLDDTDQYFETNINRRGLFSIIHVPPGGIGTVDFVTLFLRNSDTERAYVNVYMGSDISVEMRVAGIQSSYPVYSDVLMVEVDGDTTRCVAELVPATNELSIAVSGETSDKYDIVEPAHMELAEPSILTAYTKCVEKGAEFIVICPFFLGPGRHWQQDIPSLANQAAKEFPDTNYHVVTPLGVDELLLDLIEKRLVGCTENSFICPGSIILGSCKIGKNTVVGSKNIILPKKL